MQSTSDWVTRFRIFPKTWTMLSMAGSPPGSLEKECGSSTVSSSYPVVVPVHSLLYRHFLGNVFADRSNYDLVIILDSLGEKELGTGGSPITDRAVSFHGQIKRANWNVFAPDSQDAMEL